MPNEETHFNQNYLKWRSEIEHKYALLCRFCGRKVLDPTKTSNNQVFTKNKCPHCDMSKEEAKRLKLTTKLC